MMRIMKEDKEVMKYLKIEQDKGFYRLDTSKDEWLQVDQIGKDHLLKLLEKALGDTEFEMDEYVNENLNNPAHNIIYKSIFEKFKSMLENGSGINDKLDEMYKEAIDKYAISPDK